MKHHIISEPHQPDPRFMLSRLADFRGAHIDCDGYNVEYDGYGMIATVYNWKTCENIVLSPTERVALWEDYLAHVTALCAQRLWERPFGEALSLIVATEPPVKLAFLLNISGLTEASPFRLPGIEQSAPDDAIDLDQIRARFPYLTGWGHTPPSLAAELALLLIHTELLDHILPLRREAALITAAEAIIGDKELAPSDIGAEDACLTFDQEDEAAMSFPGCFPPCAPPEIGLKTEGARLSGEQS